MDLARNQWFRAFGLAVNHFRTKRGISQEALALAAGVNRTHMNVLETGRSNPSLDTMLKVCAALDISFVELAREIEKHLKKRRAAR